MRKFLLSVLSVITLAMAFLVSSCRAVENNPETVEVQNVYINGAKDLVEGETLQLSVTINPDNATDKTVSWLSSDEEVLTVNKAGLVTAKAKGCADVVAKAGGKSATVTINVSKKIIEVSSVKINGNNSVVTGNTLELSCEVLPEDATDKSVIWSSSDTSIATVSDTGVVTGVKAGEVTITVTSADGSKSDSLTVTVSSSVINVSSVSISAVTTEVGVDSSISLTAAVLPENATNKKLSWTSSDTSVATVSDAGLVTGKKAGQATITVTTEDGNKSDSISITVKKGIVSVSAIAISGTTALDVDSTSTLTATVTPSDATNKNVTWSSADTSIATVSSTGVVTGKKAGSTTITATAADGSGISKTVTVTVNEKAPSEDISSKLNFTMQTAVGGAWIHLKGTWTDSAYALTKSSLDTTNNKPVIDGNNNFANILDGECSSGSSSYIWGIGFATAGFVGAGNHTNIFYITANSQYYKVEISFAGKNSTANEEFEINSVKITAASAPSDSGSDPQTPSDESKVSAPESAPDVTIPSDAYVIHNSTKSVSTFGGSVGWTNDNSVTMSNYTYTGSSKKAKQVTFTKGSYEAFFVNTTQLDTSASPKLYMHVYAAHNFGIKAMTTNREDTITVASDGNWAWKTVEYNMGSASEITMICFTSSVAQTIYVDKVYVTGAKVSSQSGSGSGTGASEDLKSISISGSDSVKETAQINLTCTANPSSASLGTVTWSSSDETIAVVSNKGTVTGLKQGTVTIKAYAGDFEASKTITVTADVDPESQVTKPSDITTNSSYPAPFGVVCNGGVGDGKFTICSGAPNPMADYWDLFITGGDFNNKKVKLGTCGVVEVKVGKAATYNLSLYGVYVVDGVPKYSPAWTGSVTVTTNATAKVLPDDADARLANRTLVQKKDTTTLTLQFENNTGKWSDDQIWVTGYGRNKIGEWCYLNKDGTAIPISAGTTSKDWSFRFSDVDSDWGLQCKDFSSSRIYFTCGDEPVTMNAVVDGDGNVGVAQPNMAIENDANATKYFDWIEFTSGGVLYVNTTQVDAFTFPIVVADYADDGMGGYEWKKSVGVTKSRAEVFSAWNTWTNTYTNYKNLVRCNGTRILAPCKVPKTDFDMTYMDSYIADVWNYYKTHDLYYSESEHGTYSGHVQEVTGTDGKTKNVLIMTRAGDNKKFYVYDTPNMEEAFEGSGKLAMDCSPSQSMEWFGTEAYGNSETSKNVQNRICSAFTRHAFIKQGSDYINVMDDPSRYYSEEPANMYSAFMHKEAGNLDGYAYGFAYDDNHDQSTTTVDGNCRGVIVGIGRWN